MKNRALQLGLAGVILLGLGVSAAAQGTNSPALAAPGSNLAGSFLRLTGALVFVFALFFAGIWVFRNWQRLVVQKGRPAKLNIIEVKHLGQRHAIYVVGYEQQRLLLASSPAGVSLLSHLPASDVAAEEQAAAPAAAPVFAFGDVLQHALGRRS